MNKYTAFIYVLVGIFLCSDVSYARDESLRIPNFSQKEMRRRTFIGEGIAALGALIYKVSHAQSMGVYISAPKSGVRVTVDEAGYYYIETDYPAPIWRFRGKVDMDEGSVLANIKSSEGIDRIGRYYEVTFDYVLEGKSRTSGIRIYEDKPVAVFTTNYRQASLNKKAFPKFQCSEEGLYGFSYHDIWNYGFGNPGMGPESPWLFFNSSGNAFIISPAANFMISRTDQDDYRYITSGVDSKITVLPANFSHQVMLVFGSGINKTFDTWGQAMTDLQGKVRPANDADILLEGISAWHSAGGSYYYYEPLEDFARVLKGLRDDFSKQGIRLRLLHLDGWWSQKGKGGYGSSKYFKEGVYLLRPDPAILPYGLAEFQKDLGIPLSVHSRWWSPYSPDRNSYMFSRDVPVDPKYWKNLAAYLKESGVRVFEQDWLDELAAPLRNLNDARDFLNNMAQAMKEAGITMQYCMPRPSHFLKTSKHSNITTIRCSPDRFAREQWDVFLYHARLAGALGIWPFTDNFLSEETLNLLIAVLSAGPIGIGDAIGSINGANLLQAVRPDGVIVKPDAPIVPTDRTYIAEVYDPTVPMVASTYAKYGDFKISYVFAYQRSQKTSLENVFTPASLGIDRPVYIYNYFTKEGCICKPDETFQAILDYNGSYYIAVPVISVSKDNSSMVFLGDESMFVAFGKKRISELKEDNDGIAATVIFSENERSVILHGYAEKMPVFNMSNGQAELLEYDNLTKHFRIRVMPGRDLSAEINISISSGLSIPASLGAFL